jgi:hypothetical protein
VRRLSREPLTGGPEWVLIEAPGGGVLGVPRRSPERPFKTAGFAEANRDLEGKARYADWKFFYRPADTPAAAAR